MEVTGTPAMGQATQVAGGEAVPQIQGAAQAETVQPKSDEFVKKAQAERELWAKQKAIKQRESEIAQREARIKESETKYQSYEQTKQQARLNPIKYLQEAGLTPEDLVQFQLNNGSPTPDLQYQQLRSELEETKRSLKEKEEAQVQQTQAQQQRAADQAISDFKTSISDHIQGKPEDYELILAASDTPEDAANFIYDIVDAHWKQSVERYEESGNDPKLKPKVLSMDEAAGLLEKAYEEKMEKALSGKKLGSKYKRIEEALAEVAKEVKSDSKFTRTEQPPRTLHNGLTTQAIANPGRPVSMEEKMQRAAALMKKK